MKKTVLNYLRQTPMREIMNDEELEKLTEDYEVTDYNPGDVLFNEDDRADKMLIIVEGEIEIVKRMGAGERVLSMLYPGDCLGELALITNEVRAATARAYTAVRCLEIGREPFNRLMDENHNYTHYIMQVIINRLKYTEMNTNQFILKAYNTLMMSLSNLAEARDNETGAHLYRVRGYCKLLARKLAEIDEFKPRVTPEFIDNIYTVSPLHDIGKVAIPDNILLKPGKLTGEEFEEMKKHSWLGGRVMLKLMEDIHFPTFEMAFNVVNYHHERFDGSGYPRGLKGEKIPLEARIMALADVFDALMSKRVYKPAFSREKVQEIMLEERGTIFDPVLTDIFLGHFSEFEAIYRQYAD